MRYRSWFAFCLLLIVIIVIFYSFYTEEYFIILPSLQIPTTAFLSSHTNLHSLSDLLAIANNSEYSQPLFQSRLSPYYPRLPIHIYTQNVTSLKGPAKLILLGNGFFGDKTWGFSAIGKSPTELSKHIKFPEPRVSYSVILMFAIPNLSCSSSRLSVSVHVNQKSILDF